MTTMIMSNEILNETELSMISGGSWGFNEIKNEDVYKSCGIVTKWSCNPFVRDKFYYNGQRIEDATAAAICFYKMTTNDGLNSNISIAEALRYKAGRGDEYIKWIKKMDKTDWCQ